MHAKGCVHCARLSDASAFSRAATASAADFSAAAARLRSGEALPRQYKLSRESAARPTCHRWCGLVDSNIVRRSTRALRSAHFSAAAIRASASFVSRLASASSAFALAPTCAAHCCACAREQAAHRSGKASARSPQGTREREKEGGKAKRFDVPRRQSAPPPSSVPAPASPPPSPSRAARPAPAPACPRPCARLPALPRPCLPAAEEEQMRQNRRDTGLQITRVPCQRHAPCASVDARAAQRQIGQHLQTGSHAGKRQLGTGIAESADAPQLPPRDAPPQPRRCVTPPRRPWRPNHTQQRHAQLPSLHQRGGRSTLGL